VNRPNGIHPVDRPTRDPIRQVETNRPPRRRYAVPRLTVVAQAGDLLEALGPAQANYGGTGMP
jgi:hypothetical protein